MLLFFNIGGSELLFILLVILLLFGSKKFPELARGLGKGIRQLRDAASGVEEEISKEIRQIKDEVKLNRRSTATHSQSHTSKSSCEEY